MAAAAAALLVAAVRPSPWLLASVLWMCLGLVWFEAFTRHTRQGITITDRV